MSQLLSGDRTAPPATVERLAGAMSLSASDTATLLDASAAARTQRSSAGLKHVDGIVRVHSQFPNTMFGQWNTNAT